MADYDLLNVWSLIMCTLIPLQIHKIFLIYMKDFYSVPFICVRGSISSSWMYWNEYLCLCFVGVRYYQIYYFSRNNGLSLHSWKKKKKIQGVNKETRGLSSVAKKSSSEHALKRPRIETPSPSPPTFKVLQNRLSSLLN